MRTCLIPHCASKIGVFLKRGVGVVDAKTKQTNYLCRAHSVEVSCGGCNRPLSEVRDTIFALGNGSFLCDPCDGSMGDEFYRSRISAGSQMIICSAFLWLQHFDPHTDIVDVPPASPAAVLKKYFPYPRSCIRCGTPTDEYAPQEINVLPFHRTIAHAPYHLFQQLPFCERCRNAEVSCPSGRLLSTKPWDYCTFSVDDKDPITIVNTGRGPFADLLRQAIVSEGRRLSENSHLLVQTLKMHVPWNMAVWPLETLVQHAQNDLLNPNFAK